MATLQSVNGKAPGNAKVGDSIVTGGGTYKITGQNADGSWISEKVSDVAKANVSTPKAPTNYAGSATNVGTVGSNQAAIKAQMNANSQKWYEAATQAEKDALHAENQRLAAQLGGSVSYDGSTGLWSGSAELVAPEPENFTPTDQSEYLRQMASAYNQKQQEALKQAYEANLSNLQAEQEKLGTNYQTARNAEAADSALSRQRFNETAAAYGLNSGTMGQANLSYANQLQSDLSALQAAEAAANAEIERQRTNLAKEYQSAMIQAQAENNYQLFQQLYNEAVRLDEALQNQSQYNSSMAMQTYQTMLDKYNADRTFDYTVSQNERQDKLDAAALAAQFGDYSLYGELYGWDPSKIAQMEAMYRSASSGGSRGGGSAGSPASGGADYDGLFAAARASGYPETFLKQKSNYQQYGLNSAPSASDYEAWLDATIDAENARRDNAINPSNASGLQNQAWYIQGNQDFGSNYNTAWQQARNMYDNGKSGQDILSYLNKFDTAQLTDAGAMYILNSLGLAG